SDKDLQGSERGRASPDAVYCVLPLLRVCPCRILPEWDGCPVFGLSPPQHLGCRTRTLPAEMAAMPKKILIVEDDFDTRYGLSLILQTEGYDVVTAADGECALAVASQQKPDLIITDISMPRLNGVELTRRIKRKKETAGIPILAITAYGQTTMRNVIS